MASSHSSSANRISVTWRVAFSAAVIATGALPAVGQTRDRTAAPNFADSEDFELASRGFVATRKDPLIKTADGRVVWNLNAYNFLNGTAAPTVNPSLWRQAQLLSKHGLFKVRDGIWQVRGFDLSNVTFIQGKSGWIVVDPLTSVEAAKAALDLVTEQLGARPVVAMIYTHSHADHFAGARGIVDQAGVDTGRVQIIAPEGFLEHAVSENIIAGTAMGRRGAYQFGYSLAQGPEGQVSSGIGQAVSAGTQSLIPPTLTIARTGTEMIVDGVRLQFELTPGTEAPAEMNIFLPDLKALCLAENANAGMHNVLTPRGALVRDAKLWADYLTEAQRLYGAQSDVMFTSHAWPRFGNQAINDFILKHRDAYKYLHDQSVRLMNAGLTPNEIANRIKLPAALAREWYNRGYYGTMSFNSRAVYQRYMGWYDGNPVNLAPLEPVDEARRYVAAMGGDAKVLGLARAAFEAQDYRWAAQLLNRLVFASSTNDPAKALLAQTYDQLGFAAESAIWRNMYLSAAAELRTGIKTRASGTVALDYLRNTPTAMLLDLVAVRLNPEKVADATLAIDLEFPERNERFRVMVRNSVLTYERDPAPGVVDATVKMARAQFLALAFARSAAPGTGAVDTGSAAALKRLVDWLDVPKSDFPIVWRP